jgi:hypothetical protein
MEMHSTDEQFVMMEELIIRPAEVPTARLLVM